MLSFVFPGQGAQFVGMGRDLAQRVPGAMEVFTVADQVLGFSLSDLCWNGPEEALKQTINTQPAIVAMSLACCRALQQEGIEPDLVAGHSVGEYAALVAAGVLDVASGIRLVRRRGEFMQEAGTVHPSTMAAIVGLSSGKVEEICREASSAGVVVLANLNSPDQMVISGDLTAVEAARNLALKAGAKRAIPLAVSAAFHSPLMEEAAAKLAEELDKTEFRDARIPIVANISARPIQKAEEIREALKGQITARVLWEESVRTMRRSGVTAVVEAGPGKVLSGLIKRIEPEMKLFNVQDILGVEKAKEGLFSPLEN
ncbi:MAG: ACP S-malonyltransferase [bacterium]